MTDQLYENLAEAIRDMAALEEAHDKVSLATAASYYSAIVHIESGQNKKQYMDRMALVWRAAAKDAKYVKEEE